MLSRDFQEKLLNKSKQDQIEKLLAGAVVLDKNERNFLLLKRSERDFMPGLEEIPSGGVEKNESLFDACSRELLEETGLELDEVIQFLSSFDYLSQSGKRSRQFNFWVTVKKYKPISLLDEEHSSFRWCPIDKLDDLNEEIRDIIVTLMKRKKNH